MGDGNELVGDGFPQGPPTRPHDFQSLAFLTRHNFPNLCKDSRLTEAIIPFCSHL